MRVASCNPRAHYVEFRSMADQPSSHAPQHLNGGIFYSVIMSGLALLGLAVVYGQQSQRMVQLEVQTANLQAQIIILTAAREKNHDDIGEMQKQVAVMKAWEDDVVGKGEANLAELAVIRTNVAVMAAKVVQLEKEKHP